MNEDKNNKPKDEAVEVIFQQAENQLTIQFQSIDSLDNKLGILLGFQFLLLALVANALTPDLLRSLGMLSIFLILASIFIFSAIWTSCNSYDIEEYSRSPKIDKIWERYWDKDRIQIKQQLIANLNEDYESNKEKMERKGNAIKTSIRLLKLSMAYILSYILLFIISNGGL